MYTYLKFRIELQKKCVYKMLTRRQPAAAKLYTKLYCFFADRAQLLKEVVYSLIDKIMNLASSFMDKVSNWLTFPAIPWEKFTLYWNQFITSIMGWNRIFPVYDVLIIFGLMIAVFGALIIFYTVVLIKSFIPFSGGK